MKPKKYISIILLFVMFFSIIGCDNGNIQVSKNPVTNRETEVTINSEINKYSPLMSSTPGMPLVADFTSNTKAENIKYHWITEQGTFLNWEQDNGRANILGKDVKINEQKIYWSIDPYEEINKSPLKYT